MKKIVFKPEFINTKNVRNFTLMMDALMTYNDEGRLGLIYGRAGHGKSRTSEWYAINNDCIYLRIVPVWSELDFLRALCRELGDVNPPKRKGPAFAIITDLLRHNPRPVFLDEVEQLKNPKRFLEIIRTFSDISAAPVIMLGEEELFHLMQQSDRISSRTYRNLRFDPIEAADIMAYTQATSGIKLSASQAGRVHKETRGDLRDIKRILMALIDFLYGRGKDAPDDDLVKQAIKSVMK